MTTTTRIYLLERPDGRYDVHLDGGEQLLTRSKDPEFASARALLARGVTGRLETWRAGATSPGMVLDIETAAKLSTRERDRAGRPAIEPYVPHPLGRGNTGKREGAATLVPPNTNASVREGT